MLTYEQALLKTADFIEQNPHRYNFGCLCIPNSDDPRSEGCLLGWTGHFLGLPVGAAIGSVTPLGGYDDGGRGFYEDMDSALGTHDWILDAACAARGLRLLAAGKVKEAA